MTRVLLDANALMMPVEVGVRVFDELDRLLGAPPGSEARSSRPAVGVRAGPKTTERVEPTVESGNKAGFDSTGEGVDAGSAENAEDGATGSGIDGVTLLVPVAVIDELDRLSNGRGKEGTAASVGADLARERCTILPHDAAYADDAICELAADPREVIDYVCTNDRDLRERLGVHGVPVICLRGHNQLAIQNP